MCTLSARHGRDFLPRENLQPVDQVEIGVTVPFFIEPRIELLDLVDIHERILNMSLDQVTDAGFRCGRQVLRILAVDQTLSRAGSQKSVEDIDRRTLARTVLAQQAENAAFTDRDVQVFVNQFFAIVVRQVAALYYIFAFFHQE